MDSSMQALGGGIQTYCAGNPPQLQLLGLPHTPVAMQDGTIVTLSPQQVCASTECPTPAPLQLQGMQAQLQQVSTVLAMAAGGTCPVMLQGGTVLLPFSQQHSGQDSSAAPLGRQPLQQQQQVPAPPLGVGICAASPNGTSVLALQSSAGTQHLQQLPLSLGPLDQQQLHIQQPQLQEQHQPSQLQPQYQVLVLGSGQLVGAATAPVQQQSHAISSPASACSGSAGHAVQVLSSTQGLSCAAGQQLQQEVIQQHGLLGQQVPCAPGSTGHDVHPAQYEIGLVMTDAGMQVQIVPAQAVQGPIVEDVVVAQACNTSHQSATVLPAANTSSSRCGSMSPAVPFGTHTANGGSDSAYSLHSPAQASTGALSAAQGLCMTSRTTGGSVSAGNGRQPQQHGARTSSGATRPHFSASRPQSALQQFLKQGGSLGSHDAVSSGLLDTMREARFRSPLRRKPVTQPVQGLARVRAARKAAQLSSHSSGLVPAWALATVEEGLGQLWSSEQLQRAKGGRMYNTHKSGEQQVEDTEFPCAAEMYNFARLKRIIQQLDALCKVRAELIKRIHVLVESGNDNLKAVYCEVRAYIGFMLRDAAIQIESLSKCRVVGLIRLALLLQLALEEGPTAQGGQQQQQQQQQGPAAPVGTCAATGP